MTILTLGLSCESDSISHKISHPSTHSLFLLAWLLENYRPFLLLTSWQFEKKQELPRALLALWVFAHTSACVCVSTSMYVHVCPQGPSRSVSRAQSGCLLYSFYLNSFYLNSVLILPEIRPEMWLTCERFS